MSFTDLIERASTAGSRLARSTVLSQAADRIRSTFRDSVAQGGAYYRHATTSKEAHRFAEAVKRAVARTIERARQEAEQPAAQALARRVTSIAPLASSEFSRVLEKRRAALRDLGRDAMVDAMLNANPRFADGRTMVDVGAGSGQPLKRLAPRFRDAYAFEPNPIARRRLEATLLLDGGPHRETIAISPVALSDREGPTYIGVDVDAPESAALIGHQSRQRHFLVRTMRFDDWADTKEIDVSRIGFISIDAPDHQRFVIAGMARFLTAHRPLLALHVCDLLDIERMVATLRPFGFAHYYAKRCARHPLADIAATRPRIGFFDPAEGHRPEVFFATKDAVDLRS